MRIHRPRIEVGSTGLRLAAGVEWEEADRPPRDISFEIDSARDGELSESSDPFLLATFPFAFRHGERRIALEGTVCPVLRNGVVAAMQILRGWYDPSRRLPEIEASDGFRPAAPAVPLRVASVFSGGLDSLFTLRRNLIEIPREHPFAIRDVIFVVGHDHPITNGGGWPPESFYEPARRSIERIASRSDVRAVFVRSNVRDLDPSYELFLNEQFGAGLASVAQALGRRYTTLLIPASLPIGVLEPNGSSPILDQFFSSATLTVRHDGAEFSRIEKLRLVADWDDGLACLRVCHETLLPEEYPNCGICEKCLRTRVALLILGRLDSARTFPPGDVTAAQLQRVGWTVGFEGWWSELFEGTRRIGRDDLAAVISRKIAAARRYRAWKNEEDWKGWIKRFDRKVFGGRVRRALRTVSR